MLASAVARAICYASRVIRSRRRPKLGESGISIVEVLAVTVVIGIAVVGVALMFGKGSAWVSAIGDDRVAAGLAQERIEQIRAAAALGSTGWSAVTKEISPGDCLAAAGSEQPLTRIGCLIKDAPIRAGNAHTFTRTVCLQYVGTDEGLGRVDGVGVKTVPEYSPACPGGVQTKMIRATVVVSSSQPETSPVTLQAWMVKP
jgi:Tfp pilus assembly protein PilV